jgi:hypothetical protein
MHNSLGRAINARPIAAICYSPPAPSRLADPPEVAVPE